MKNIFIICDQNFSYRSGKEINIFIGVIYVLNKKYGKYFCFRKSLKIGIGKYYPKQSNTNSRSNNVIKNYVVF